MIQKIYGSFIIIFFLLSCHSIILGATSEKQIHWAAEAMYKLEENGYYEIKEKEWNPDSAMTAGEIAVMVNRCFSFTKDNQEETDMERMHQKGFLLRFEEEDHIPRQEVAIFIGKLMGADIDEEDTTSFMDDATIAEWARGYVAWLQRKKIVIGYPDFSFQPTQDITKAEFITIINRCMEDDGQVLVTTDERNVSHLEVGIFKYEEGNIVISAIEDSLKMKFGEVVQLAVSISEELEDEKIVVTVENPEIVELDEELYTISALKEGKTKLNFEAGSGECFVSVEVVVE